MKPFLISMLSVFLMMGCFLGGFFLRGAWPVEEEAEAGDVVGIYHNLDWNGEEVALFLNSDGTCYYPGGYSGTYECQGNQIIITLSISDNTHTAYVVEEGIILHGHFFEKK